MSDPNSQPPPLNPLNDKLYKIEGVLKLIYLPGLVILPGMYLKIMLVVVFLLAIIRNYGMPVKSREYGLKVIGSEFAANILYLAVISIASSQNSSLFFLPLTIHLSSGIIEFISRTNLNRYIQSGKLKEIADTIKSRRNELIVIKNKIEIGLLMFLLVLWFLGGSSIFQIIVYLQFLSIKNKFNRNMQFALTDLRSNISQSGLPAILKGVLVKVYDGMLKVINFI